MEKYIKKNKFQVEYHNSIIGGIHTIQPLYLHLSPQYSSIHHKCHKIRKQSIGEQTGHKVPIISPTNINQSYSKQTVARKARRVPEIDDRLNCAQKYLSHSIINENHRLSKWSSMAVSKQLPRLICVASLCSKSVPEALTKEKQNETN
jgi:hypothetical protein